MRAAADAFIICFFHPTSYLFIYLFIDPKIIWLTKSSEQDKLHPESEGPLLLVHGPEGRRTAAGVGGLRQRGRRNCERRLPLT